MSIANMDFQQVFVPGNSPWPLSSTETPETFAEPSCQLIAKSWGRYELHGKDAEKRRPVDAGLRVVTSALNVGTTENLSQEKMPCEAQVPKELPRNSETLMFRPGGIQLCWRKLPACRCRTSLSSILFQG